MPEQWAGTSVWELVPGAGEVMGALWKLISALTYLRLSQHSTFVGEQLVMGQDSGTGPYWSYFTNWHAAEHAVYASRSLPLLSLSPSKTIHRVCTVTEEQWAVPANEGFKRKPNTVGNTATLCSSASPRDSVIPWWRTAYEHNFIWNRIVPCAFIFYNTHFLHQDTLTQSSSFSSSLARSVSKLSWKERASCFPGFWDSVNPSETSSFSSCFTSQGLRSAKRSDHPQQSESHT